MLTGVARTAGAAVLVCGAVSCLGACASRAQVGGDRASAANVATSALPVAPAVQNAIDRVTGLAKMDGDASPTTVDSLQSTYYTVYPILFPNGGQPQGPDRTVVAVIEQGTFVGNSFPEAPGSSPVKGSTLFAVVDPVTDEIGATGISDTAPNLSAVGTVDVEHPGGN